MKKLFALALLVMIIPFSGSSQDQAHIEVSGWVTDFHTQVPLVGCHVFMDDHFGTVVNKDGYFEIRVPVAQMSDPLYFSYVGYETKSSPVNELTYGQIQVQMLPSLIILDEVIVVADPWDEFRRIIEDLAVNYSDKDDLLEAIMNELEAMDINTEEESDTQKKGE